MLREKLKSVDFGPKNDHFPNFGHNKYIMPKLSSNNACYQVQFQKDQMNRFR